MKFGISEALFLLVFLAIVVPILVFTIRSESDLALPRKTLAKEHGWTYSFWDWRLYFRLSKYVPDYYSIRSKMVMTVESGSRTIHVFECVYGMEPEASDPLTTGCLIESPRFSSNRAGQDLVIMYQPGVGSRIDGFEMGGPPFVQRYSVWARDREAAKQIVSPAIQSLLVEYAPSYVSVSASGALVLSYTEVKNIPRLVEFCRSIEAAMPK